MKLYAAVKRSGISEANDFCPQKYVDYYVDCFDLD